MPIPFPQPAPAAGEQGDHNDEQSEGGGAVVDVLVVGGGVAGVSAAAELAARGRSVVLSEREPQLAYHTTGRSAALYFENYGHPAIRGLSRASRQFFEHPPKGLTDARLLSPRGALSIARAEKSHRIDRWVADAERQGTPVEELTTSQALELVPVLRATAAAAAVLEPDAADIDVAAIHQSFVRAARRHDTEIRTSCGLRSLTRRPTGWRAHVGDQRVDADVVVNAAGAWCDEVAAMAEVPAIGLIPKRRTAFMVSAPDNSKEWPLVVEVDHEFYFKPDGVQLLCSPADETPSPPCDARPHELDIAIAIERINDATTLGIRSIRSSWAGLRSFVSDGAMVVGFEPETPGFFWLAGQGGTGIQTAPAAARLTADLICDGTISDELSAFGVCPDALAPDRLR